VQLDKSDIASALKTKGFDESLRDHRYYTYRSKSGLLSHIYTKISHSGKTIDDGLIGQMAKQVRLKKPQFLDLVKCPLSRDRYEELLIEQGEIEPSNEYLT
jgi:predicted RNA binding protein YcfA (HicA-like mRNA interferase family)